MDWRWIFRMAWRDSRSQRRKLLGVTSSVALGIGALAAVHGLNATAQRAVEREANALLGSDAQLTNRTGFCPADDATLRILADEVARETSFSSMLLIGDGAGLVQVRALAGGYPFYGSVETDPTEAWAGALAGEGVVLEPSLLDRFQARVGDIVRLGRAELPILGVIRKPLPRSSRFAAFAPELITAESVLPLTGLLEQTSLVFHHRHVQVSAPEQITAIRQAAESAGWQFQQVDDRRDQLGGAFERFQQFLAMLAVSALVLGAIGVAGAVEAHVRRRIVPASILRCLGCPAESAAAIFAVQAWALGLFGAVGGVALGAGLHAGVVWIAREVVPFPLELFPPRSTLLTTGVAGFAVCAAFAALPLLGLRRAVPVRALREVGVGAGQRAGAGLRLTVALLGAISVWGLLRAGGIEPMRAVGMVAGLGIAFGLLALVAQFARWAVRHAGQTHAPFWLRQGVANLSRPGNQTGLFLLALGAGAFLLCLVMLVRDSLLQRIEVARDPASPNLYLVDVQPDQVEAVIALTRASGTAVLETAPVVTMRIAAVNGVEARVLEEKGRVPKWILQREFRSSYRPELNGSERVLAGQWWNGTGLEAGTLAVSLEQELARDLNVGIGDGLELDVVGRRLQAQVTSLREVDWSRFNLNFFMVFRPGDLAGAPAFYLVAARLPDGTSSGPLQRKLAESFPNVSSIDLALVLQRVREILGQIATVVEALAWLTAAAGIGAVTGLIANGQEDRLRESVLLRTLGADRGLVEKILLAEHALLGLLAGMVGAILAAAANAALAIWVFKSDPWPAPGWLLAFALGPAIVSAALGWWLGRGISSRPPLEELWALDPGSR